MLANVPLPSNSVIGLEKRYKGVLMNSTPRSTDIIIIQIAAPVKCLRARPILVMV